LFNILCNINRIHKILLLLCLRYVYSLFSFLVPHISLESWVTYIHLLLLHQPSPLCYTQSLYPRSDFVHPYNVYINERGELSKFSIASQRPNPVVSSTRQYCLHPYLSWVKLIIKRKVYEILNDCWEKQSGLHRPVKFSICLIIHTKSGIYRNWFVIVNLYIIWVITWCFLVMHFTQYLHTGTITSKEPVLFQFVALPEKKRWRCSLYNTRSWKIVTICNICLNLDTRVASNI
jgi:hypothetical protein